MKLRTTKWSIALLALVVVGCGSPDAQTQPKPSGEPKAPPVPSGYTK